MKRTMKDLELHVVVLEALHLPKKDVWGSCDAYVVIKLGQRQTFQTHVLKNSLSPHWEEGGNLQLANFVAKVLDGLRATFLRHFSYRMRVRVGGGAL